LGEERARLKEPHDCKSPGLMDLIAIQIARQKGTLAA